MCYFLHFFKTILIGFDDVNRCIFSILWVGIIEKSFQQMCIVLIGCQVVLVLLQRSGLILNVVFNSFLVNKERLDQLYFYQLFKGACEFRLCLEYDFDVTLLALFVVGEPVFDLLDRKRVVVGREGFEDGFGFVCIPAYKRHAQQVFRVLDRGLDVAPLLHLLVNLLNKLHEGSDHALDWSEPFFLTLKAVCKLVKSIEYFGFDFLTHNCPLVQLLSIQLCAQYPRWIARKVLLCLITCIEQRLDLFVQFDFVFVIRK